MSLVVHTNQVSVKKYYEKFLTLNKDYELFLINNGLYIPERFKKCINELLENYDTIEFNKDNKKIGYITCNKNSDKKISVNGLVSEYEEPDVNSLEEIYDFKRIKLYQNQAQGNHISFMDFPFIIHLEKDTNRIPNIIELAKNLKRFFVVDAISYTDGSQKLKKMVDDVIYRNYKDSNLYEDNKGSSVSYGSVCVGLSNILILNYCLKHNIETPYIFEDDILVLKELKHIEHANAELPKDCNLVQWGAKKDRIQGELGQRISSYWELTGDKYYGAHAYSLHGTETINKVRSKFIESKLPIDMFIKIFSDLKCYSSYIDFFIQKMEYDSNIRNNDYPETYSTWGWDINNYVQV